MAKRDGQGRFLKGGGSPNPGGRPRGDILKQIGLVLQERDAQGVTNEQKIARVLVETAAAGEDIRYLIALLDRLAPKVSRRQTMVMTGSPKEFISVG